MDTIQAAEREAEAIRSSADGGDGASTEAARQRIDEARAEAERIAPGGYDVILDANGVATLKDSYKHLTKAGKLVVYGFTTMMPKKGGKPNWLKLALGFVRTPRFSPLEMTRSSKSVLAFNLSYLFDRVDLLHEAMKDIEGWLDQGAIKPAPVTTYPLSEVARAHADIESGRTVGKLILVP